MWARADGMRAMELGRPGASRTALNALVLTGAKRATAGLLADDYADEVVEHVGERLALVGDPPAPGAAPDAAPGVLAVLEVTRVERRCFADVDWEFARSEGEGYADLAEWHASHRAYWEADGHRVDADSPVVLVWFRLAADPAPVTVFRAARDLLLARSGDYAAARRDFRWPVLAEFNWALDHFDALAADPATAGRAALWIVEADGSEGRWTYADLARRSDQVAAWLRGLGVARGDRVVLMLGNTVELWEVLLAAMKLGAVVIPSTPLLGVADLADRVVRGQARHVVAAAGDAAKVDEALASVGDPGPPTPGAPGAPGAVTRICVGGQVPGWTAYAGSAGAPEAFAPDGPTRADDPLLLYFTSGTTARPKLVEHTHVSYPVGHLSTMYWLGVRPGDVHLNISSPGWAKHAWSNVFAPWIAGATVFVHNAPRFDAAALLDVLARYPVTTFCAPPTVWRLLVQADLSRAVPDGGGLRVRELVSAGEPLNPEVIECVERAWGRTVRDGFGQTETTLQVGNTPGQPVRPGSMGRPAPGYEVVVLDPVTGAPARTGEICLDLSARPLGLMAGYRDDPGRTAEATAGGYYHTGDVGTVDDDGYLTYVGRSDDVFKASDYRISPFELESVLIEHPAVAEAAVVPSPDPLRLAVPKAYVVLAAGHAPDAATAQSVLAYARAHLAPFQRIRRLEFAELPKTISGKIRRVELRAREAGLHADPSARPAGEFREEDFPGLRGG